MYRRRGLLTVSGEEGNGGTGGASTASTTNAMNVILRVVWVVVVKHVSNVADILKRKQMLARPVGKQDNDSKPFAAAKSAGHSPSAKLKCAPRWSKLLTSTAYTITGCERIAMLTTNPCERNDESHFDKHASHRLSTRVESTQSASREAKRKRRTALMRGRYFQGSRRDSGKRHGRACI